MKRKPQACASEPGAFCCVRSMSNGNSYFSPFIFCQLFRVCSGGWQKMKGEKYRHEKLASASLAFKRMIPRRGLVAGDFDFVNLVTAFSKQLLRLVEVTVEQPFGLRFDRSVVVAPLEV